MAREEKPLRSDPRKEVQVVIMLWFILCAMYKMLFILLFLARSLFASPNCSVSMVEVSALHDLYLSTNGPDWFWNVSAGSYWNFSVSNPNPCFPIWQGITCEEIVPFNCSIVNVELSQMNLTGSLSESLADLSFLVTLNLASNNIKGALPTSLGRLTFLEEMLLGYNDISGFIPSTYCGLSSIYSMDLSINSIKGHIPQCMGNLSSLQKVNLNGNKLSGRIPESISLLNTTLSQLWVKNNYLTGSIPFSLLNSSVLISIELANNHITGPIPAVDLPAVTYIDFCDNLLEGKFPASFCNFELALDFICLAGNSLTGTIPECISNMSVYEMYLDKNEFTGTLPSFFKTSFLDISECSLTGSISESFLGSVELFYLVLQSNLLTGTIPTDLNKLTILNTLYIQNNIFTGTLPNVGSLLVGFSLQYNLLTGPIKFSETSDLPVGIKYFTANNNELSGSIPNNLYDTAPLLKTFSISSNCITGSIPSNICKLDILLYLGLDGLSTAKSCRHYLLPAIRSVKSYSLENHIVGGIPSCIFSMPNIQTLQVSGNSIAWSFPKDLNISKSLTDLSLSYNRITGPIPNVVQQKQWTTLDLGYNKLNGIINKDIQVLPDTSLHLQVNRLSGNLPDVILKMEDVNVLSGNMFECTVLRSDLPTHDEAHDTYQCGSNSFNEASVAWCVLAGVGILIVGVFYHSWFELTMGMYREVIHSADGIVQLQCFLRKLCNFIIGITLAICGILLPVYSVLTVYFGTSTYQYAWTVSAAFISGATPALLLLILYCMFCLLLFGLWWKYWRNSEVVVVSRSVRTWNRFLVLCGAVGFNCVIIGIVNGVFVAIILSYGAMVVTLASIAMALFKLLWNEQVVKSVFQAILQFRESNKALLNDFTDSTEEEIIDLDSQMHFMAFVVLFNSIIAPCAASACVDSNCFKNAFIAPETITSTYSITYYISCTGVNCTTTQDVTYHSVTFDPPFIYSYQCTSAVLTNYASVYVYMFLMVAFLKPVFLWLLAWAYESSKHEWFHRCMNIIVPSLLRPATDEYLLNSKSLFHKDRLILSLISKLAVFVTFGVVFPPLTIVIVIATITDSVLIIATIGRFLSSIEDPLKLASFARKLDSECRCCEKLLFPPLMSLVIPFASIFWGFFVFDIWGDDVGFNKALPGSILLGIFPLLMWIVSRMKNTMTRLKEPDS